MTSMINSMNGLPRRDKALPDGSETDGVQLHPLLSEDPALNTAGSFLALLHFELGQGRADADQNAQPDEAPGEGEGVGESEPRLGGDKARAGALLASLRVGEPSVEARMPAAELSRVLANLPKLESSATLSAMSPDLLAKVAAQGKAAELRDGASQQSAQMINHGQLAQGLNPGGVDHSLPLQVLESGQAGAAQSHALKRPPSWMNNLQKVIGEQLQMQLHDGVRHAVIRLDPPHMGTLQIVIKDNPGAMQVHLIASHDEVFKQLNTLVDTMREELSQRQSGEAQVIVRHANAQANWGEPGSGNKHKQAQQKQPSHSLREASAEEVDAFASELNKDLRV